MLEAQRVLPEGQLKRAIAAFEDCFGASEMDIGWCHERDAGVPVLVVVPIEESRAKGPRILQGAKAIGEGGVVLEGLDLGLGKGVVVAGARAVVRFEDSKVREHEGNGFRGHAGAAIGMDSELSRGDVEALDGFGDQTLC